MSLHKLFARARNSEQMGQSRGDLALELMGRGIKGAPVSTGAGYGSAVDVLEKEYGDLGIDWAATLERDLKTIKGYGDTPARYWPKHIAALWHAEVPAGKMLLQARMNYFKAKRFEQYGIHQLDKSFPDLRKKHLLVWAEHYANAVRPQVEAKRAREEERRKRPGRGGTILTGAGGVTEEPTILSKKLLGG